MESPKKEFTQKTSFISMIIPWAICLLATIFYCYDFMLRVFPSVMIHPLMSAYGVQAGAIGVVSAFYYYTYTPLQLPAGIIVDKYSSRIVLTLSCLICASGALLFTVTHSFIIACIARALMGFGSAFAFVGALKLAAIWLPENRFALFAGITTTIGTLGALVVDNVLSTMVYDFGWEHTIFLTAIIGFILTVLLFLAIKHPPKQKKHAQTSEHYSWGAVFKQLRILALSPYTWLVGIIGLITFLPISVFASLWGVDFLARAYHLKTAHAASATSLVFIGIALAGPVAGYISDAIKSRKIPLFVGCLGCLIITALLIYTPGIPLYGAYVLLFLFGVFTGPQILVFAIAKDICTPSATGISTAMINFIVTIGAGLYQPLIGFALNYKWNGAKTEFGTPLFTIADYQFAFLMILVSFAICLLMIGFLPKYKKDSVE